jgi:AcrR family transcriptional regulator
MVEGFTRPGTLRDRKRRRAEDAIRKAAIELFRERGFDRVSVTDIAERAEVGRTTFFRYFGDKQEVLFPDAQAAIALAGVEAPPRPIGASLPRALRSVRAVVLAFLAHITSDPEDYALHQRLVSQHPELYARSLVKQRSYADQLAALLLAWGTDEVIARQAAELGLACFYIGQSESGDDPHSLGDHVALAFDRLGSDRRSGG